MRPRKRDTNLPPCIYSKHGAYWYVKGGKWERLGSDLPTALAEYGRKIGPKGKGMVELIDQAMPHILKNKSASTQRQYRQAGIYLQRAFKDFSPTQVKPSHVYDILEYHEDKPNMGNRMVTVLRMILSYGVKKRKLEMNPAIGVERLPEGKRERLITDGEYRAIYEAAGPRLRALMLLQYHTGQRIMDVAKIRRDDLLAEGIRFTQKKTGAKLIVGWTPGLRSAVEQAKNLHGNVKALTLLHNRRGKAPDYSTIHLQWVKACEAAGVEDACPNDIRAMSATAAKDQGKSAQALMGHKTEAMTVRYLRNRKPVEVEGPSFRQFKTVNGKPID